MQTPLYDDVDALLAYYNQDMGAAECHGMLCGMLSWPVPLNPSEWAARVLAGEFDAAVSGARPHELNHDDEAALVGLFHYTLAHLEDPELGFRLFLPDDETPLAQRAVALSAWCDGYLFGLNLAGHLELHKLSDEARDFSRDLLDIGRLDHDAEEGEEGEAAFFDIVEYVRMGVLVLRDELLALGAAGAGRRPPTLH